MPHFQTLTRVPRDFCEHQQLISEIKKRRVAIYLGEIHGHGGEFPQQQLEDVYATASKHVFNNLPAAIDFLHSDVI